jgi:selT/selW/selH-like putative selenoprotein
VEVKLQAGRRSSFEVTLDGEVLHSKLRTQEWPDTEAVLAAIARRIPG